MKNINREYYIFAFCLLGGIALILVTILDAIRERWYLFVPGIVLLGIAFLILWINKDKPAEGQYESIDSIGKAIHDWEKSVQKGGVEREKRSKKRRIDE